MITHLEDSTFLNKEMTLVSMKHEQAAAFAAEWYARVSWSTWVAMGTSGPGATNLITGIASAYFDSIPVLYITGQVNVSEITPENSWVRQTGFQETKIIPIVTPITKYASQIQDVAMLRYELEKAFFLMNHGRKWPAVLDIPMNIQRTDIDPENLISYFDSEEYKNLHNTWTLSIDAGILDQTKGLLINAKRPLILVWWGVRISWSVEKLAQFLELSHIPIVTSLMGIDSVDHSYDWYVGMIWSYGVRHANITLNQADVLLVLWSRLDIRQTGVKRDDFARNATIIHVDIDKNELGYTLPNSEVQICLDLVKFLTSLIEQDGWYPSYDSWYQEIHELSDLLPIFQEKENQWYLHPNYVCSRLSEIATPSTIFINDVWQNQMWASQSVKVIDKQRLINCWGLWSMGFSLPASIGAIFVPDVDRVISINGDGWFQMNIQELETIRYHKLPIGIIVMNNQSLGMVREFQDTYFDGRNVWTVLGYSCPNLEKIAQAYDLPFFRIWDIETLDKTFQNVQKIDWPYMIEVIISPKSLVEPKILFWNALDDQSPLLSDETKAKISIIFQKHV